MPKSKPSQVIVHRVELQEKERELAEMYFTARTLENVTKSADNLLKPTAALITAYIAYKASKELHGWGSDIFDKIRENMALAKAKRQEPVTADSFENPFNNDGYSDDGAPTNIFGLPGWGIWPGVL